MTRHGTAYRALPPHDPPPDYALLATGRAGYACQRRVEPSRSVNRKQTVPRGNSAIGHPPSWADRTAPS